MTAKLYEVYSDPYRVGGGYYEPPDITVDWVLVRAKSRGRAKSLAVKYFRRRNKHTFRWSEKFQSVEDGNPFSNLHCRRFEPVEDI